MSWFVVRINIPAAVTSMAFRVGPSGDRRRAVFPVSIGNCKRHRVTASFWPGASYWPAVWYLLERRRASPVIRQNAICIEYLR